MKLGQEFKAFINKGNVIGLAAGVIIGGGFSTIVNSLVNDIFMPILSLLTSGVDFTEWSIVMGSGENAATLNYGLFLSAILNFLIMAIVVFCFVKLMARFTVKKEEVKEAATKECPFCKSEIHKDAVKCPHCVSELGE